MSIWLWRPALTAEEEAHIRERTHLLLPFGELPDLSMITSQIEFRHLLQALHPDEPPETISRRLERIWPLYSSIHIEDIVAVPLPYRQEVILGEITGGYEYQVAEDGADRHLMPIIWHSRAIPWRALRKHKARLSPSGEPLAEITSPEIRTAIRARLPYRYNRFAQWKWLLALFFAMSILRMVNRMFGSFFPYTN